MYTDKDKKEKSILMQYPKIEGNELCDGTTHNIIPKEINSFEFRGDTLYELTYFDLKFKSLCSTIIREENAKFYKVPLQDYSDFYEKVNNKRIILKPFDISILDNVTTILADKPIETINEYSPNKKPQEIQSDPPRKRGVVPLFVDKDGNIYTRGFSAQAIFGVGKTSSFYRLSPSQLEIILANFKVEWYKFLDSKNYYPINSLKKLQERLKAFCNKNNCSNKMFKNILDSNVIYIVIQSSEDEQEYRGKFNSRNLLSGLPAFKYEEGVFKNSSCGSSPLVYLQNLTKELQEDEFINIEYLEPIYDDYYKYEFVGGYSLYPSIIKELKPLEYDGSIKNNLSSSMLGHINSESMTNGGIWVDGFLDYSFNIKEIKDSRQKKKNI